MNKGGAYSGLAFIFCVSTIRPGARLFSDSKGDFHFITNLRQNPLVLI